MTSYSRDQFLNFNEYEPGTLARTSNDNPEFLYPGNRIPNIYDSPRNPRTDTLVQRGFIRGIFPEVIKSLSEVDTKYKSVTPPIRRCFFQFNPSLILRSVQASSSTLNPLMQNPAELLQPIPGQSSFQFDLLFNREREVSNQEYLTASGIRERVTTLNESLEAYGSSPQYLQQHVGDLGVLVDLYVLDSIIGQSISSDIVETVLTYWDATKSSRNVTNGTPTETDDGTVTTTTVDFDMEKLKAGVGKVLGNSAFLNPLPVRIVFSSLFMVEGFVTSSQVAFHKFTKTMVPTVCQVTLNVQALYIGFAKKDSYLSEQIADQLRSANSLDEETEGNKNDAVNLLNTKLHLDFGFITPNSPFHPDGDPTTLNDWFVKMTWLLTNNPDVYDSNYRFEGYGSEQGLRLWIDKEFKDSVGGTLQSVSIEHMRLLFIDKSLLPKSIKNQVDFKKAVDNNKLNMFNRGARGESTFIVASATVSVEKYKSGMGLVKGKIEPKDIEKLNEGDKFTAQWTSEVFKPIPGRNPNNYFGNDVAIVFEARIKADYKDAMGNAVRQGAALTRSSVYWSFDPNSTTDYSNLYTKSGETSEIHFLVTESTVVPNTSQGNSGGGDDKGTNPYVPNPTATSHLNSLTQMFNQGKKKK